MSILYYSIILFYYYIIISIYRYSIALAVCSSSLMSIYVRMFDDSNSCLSPPSVFSVYILSGMYICRLFPPRSFALALLLISCLLLYE